MSKPRPDRSDATGRQHRTGARTARRVAGAALVAGLLLPGSSIAQQPATMTLEEAIELARRNNPEFRATANDEAVADWEVREAYGRFLPAVSLNSGISYQASGTPRLFGFFSGADVGLGSTPSYYFSDYSIGLGMTLSGATFFRAAQAQANRSATAKRVSAAAFTLASDVTRQYLAALRAQDGVAIARSALESTQESLRLAQAREAAGDATRLDAAQAEVNHGRAEVAMLQAEHLARTERLRLLQAIGIDLERDIELTSAFTVFEPAWTVEDLQASAMRGHPGLAAAIAEESAAAAGARAARSAYLPSLRLSAGWSGFVRRAGSDQYLVDQARQSAQGRIENCQFLNSVSAGLSSPLPGYPDNCSRFTLTADQEQAIRRENERFPFDFDPNPFSVSLDISLPIIDGFTRERTLQQARMAAEDAKHRRRAEELNRRAEVTTSVLALETAYRTVQLEEKNAATAAEQLGLAQERYRLGAGSILELTQAQETKVRADLARLAAIYSFHETLAALEAAVGVGLRRN